MADNRPAGSPIERTIPAATPPQPGVEVDGAPGRVRCHACGAESEILEAFFTARQSFRTAQRTVCPGCWAKEQNQGFKRLLTSYALLGAVAVILLALDASSSFARFAVNLVLFQLFSSLLILPHELGHALAARLAGMKVFQIIVGNGRTVYQGRLWGVKILFKALPFGGFAFAAPPSLAWFRVRQAIFVAAGPLAHFLMAAAVWPWLEPTGYLLLVDSSFQPARMFFYANVVLATVSLVPFHAQTVIGRIANDGLALWQLLVAPDKQRQQAEIGYHALLGMDLMERKEHQAAKEAFEAALKTYPDHATLLCNLGVSLVRLKQYAQARAAFLQVLQHKEMEPGVRFLLLNNVAYADAMLDDPALLPEAEDFSQQALANLSWHPSIKGTRGLVLVQCGRFDEGISILKEAMKAHEDPGMKALNACHLAAAEEKRGDVKTAQRYWDLARQLDPECELLSDSRRGGFSGSSTSHRTGI